MLYCESDAFENNSNELQCLSCREQRLWSASKPFKGDRNKWIGKISGLKQKQCGQYMKSLLEWNAKIITVQNKKQTNKRKKRPGAAVFICAADSFSPSCKWRQHCLFIYFARREDQVERKINFCRCIKTKAKIDQIHDVTVNQKPLQSPMYAILHSQHNENALFVPANQYNNLHANIYVSFSVFFFFWQLSLSAEEERDATSSPHYPVS